MSFVRTTLRSAWHAYFFLAARLISLILPARYWYSTLFSITNFQALLLQSLLGLSPYRTDPRRRIFLAWLLDLGLRQLVALETPFPIPVQSTGIQEITEACEDSQGVVVCSVHHPLVHCFLRSLVDIGHPPTAVVAGVPEQRRGMVPLWGSKGGLHAINPDGNVLLRARSVLRHGGIVAALVDSAIQDPIQRNIFRFIRSISARLVFVIAELQPNGEIVVDYFAPPEPDFSGDEAIELNLQALIARRDRVLHLRPSAIAPSVPAPQEQAVAVELSKFDSRP
jgi:hypothetical protein